MIQLTFTTLTRKHYTKNKLLFENTKGETYCTIEIQNFSTLNNVITGSKVGESEVVRKEWFKLVTISGKVPMTNRIKVTPRQSPLSLWVKKRIYKLNNGTFLIFIRVYENTITDSTSIPKLGNKRITLRIVIKGIYVSKNVVTLLMAN